MSINLILEWGSSGGTNFSVDEDNTYQKSFETDVNNLQEYHEQAFNNRDSPDLNSLPLLPVKKKIEEEDIDEAKRNYFKTFKKILGAARPQWPHLIFGILGALICGVSLPAYAVLFGEFYGALARVEDDSAIRETGFLCIICISIGVVAAIVGFIQTYLFNWTSLCLTMKLRYTLLVFQCIHYLENWFSNFSGSKPSDQLLHRK